MNTPVQQKTQSSYILEIDGLRAIAVLAVIAFHLSSNLLPGGFSGVDVFFVISGYVVTKSLFERRNDSFGQFLSGFYARRIKRIIPALIVCLLITSLLTVLFIPASWLSSTTSKTGLYAYFGFSNIALILFQDGYFSPRTEFNPFAHTWSLGVEEQFYLIFPLILFIWIRWQNKNVTKTIASGLLPLLILGSLYTAYWLGENKPMWSYYLLPSRFWELAAGALLFQLQSTGRAIPRDKSQANAALIIGLCLITAGYIFSDPDHFPYPWALLAVIGTVLAIYAVSNPSHSGSPLHKALGLPLLTYIGKISFSLYLWHWPIFTLFRWTVGLESVLTMAAATALSFVAAALSYHWVETPVRQTRRFNPNFATITIGLSSIALFYWLSATSFNNREDISLSVTADTKTWYPYDYAINLPEGTKTLYQGKHLFVIGDSHTGAYSTMLHEAHQRLGITVKKYQMGACTMGHLLLSHNHVPGCVERMQNLMNTIEQTSKPGDIVFFASLRTHRLVDQWVRFDKNEILEISKSSKVKENIQKNRDETSEFIERLNALKLNVIIDKPKPVFQAPPFRCSDWFNKDNPICKAGTAVDKAFLEELSKPVIQSIEYLSGRHQNLRIWDPMPTLCPGKVCNDKDNKGMPLFFDGDHLSAHGNRVLYPEFERLLKAMLPPPGP